MRRIPILILVPLLLPILAPGEREFGLMGPEIAPEDFTGTWTSQWPEGGTRTETEFIAGIPHGLHRLWNAEGCLLRRVPYYNGEWHGRRLDWHWNGILTLQEDWYHGQRHGRQLMWYPNGWKGSECVYEYGELIARIPNPGVENPLEWGMAEARRDIETGDMKILYYGMPWGYGWPPIDRDTGLSVVIMGGCFVVPETEQKIRGYNSVIREYVAEKEAEMWKAEQEALKKVAAR